MIYVSSDLHGIPLNSFLSLLDKAGFTRNDFLFVLGDVIDRGKCGIELLQWMMLQSNVQLILGNHEAMLLACDFLFHEITDMALDSLSEEKLSALSAWMFNGAQPTLTALRKLNAHSPEAVEDILDYLRDAPLFETVYVGGRDFLLTHSGLGNFEPDKALSCYTENELLWHRPTADERWFEDITTVIGHTPVACFGTAASKAFHADTWVDIDTGAAAGNFPMLLRLDDMAEFYL